jgi:hypothetical protein
VYLYLLLIAGIVVTLIAVRIILTNPPFAIATKLLPRPLRIGGAFVRVTLGELFKVFAWLANLILIGVVILIYFDILPGG